MESVWNACSKVRFIVLFRIFLQGIFRTFLLTFGFPRKIFFLEFQAVPSFLKNIFSNIRTFSEFSVFELTPIFIWNTSQLFWKSENREQKIPHAACVWDQTLFFFSCGLRRSVPSGSSSRTLTAPATPCALVSMTSPPGGITMSASTRTV